MSKDDLRISDLISALKHHYVDKFNKLNSHEKLKDTKIESVRSADGIPLFLSNENDLIARVNDGFNNIGKIFRKGSEEIPVKRIYLDDYVSPKDLVNYAKIDNFLERLNTTGNDALYDGDSIDKAPIESLKDSIFHFNFIYSIFERDGNISKISKKDKLNLLIETYLNCINKNGEDIYSEVLAHADRFADEFFKINDFGSQNISKFEMAHADEFTEQFFDINDFDSGNRSKLEMESANQFAEQFLNINDFDYKKGLKLEIYRGNQALGYFEFKDDGKYYMTLIVEQKDTSETDLLVASSLLLKYLEWSDIKNPHSGRRYILRYITNANFLKENFKYITEKLK